MNDILINTYKQIDYIIIPHKLKSHLTNSRSYNGTLTPSDHRLFVTNIITKTFYEPKQKSASHLFDRNKLKNTPLKEKYVAECSARLEAMNNPNLENLVKNIQASATTNLPKAETSNIHPSIYCPITDALSKKQKELRLAIDNLQTQDIEIRDALRQIRNQTLTQIHRQSKINLEKRIDTLAKEADQLSNTQRAFKATREIIHINTRHRPITISNSQNQTALDETEKEEILAEYFTEKYNNQSEQLTPFDQNIDTTLQNPITTDEVVKAINQLNNNKAAGPEGIPSELIKPISPILSPILADI